MTSSPAQNVVEVALGYLTSPDFPDKPAVDFELGVDLRRLGASSVPEQDRELVASQVLDAFAWSMEQLPFGIRHLDNSINCAISTLSIGSGNKSDFLTASSPQHPQVVFIVARWPICSRYRLASLIVHEAMHQALYIRERVETPARPLSLAYSPWKQRLRPGRLVWHAFWTFTVQFVFLGQATTTHTEILARDPNILDFLAEMEIRIEFCIQSLCQFNILSAPELSRIETAIDVVRQTGTELAHYPKYSRKREDWLSIVDGEVQDWAVRQATQPTSTEVLKHSKHSGVG